MHIDELDSKLHQAAELASLPSEPPLDAIHRRTRAMRRHRALAVSAAALVIVALLGVGIAGIQGSGSSETRVGVGPTTTALGTTDADDGVIPVVPHYYKATATLVLNVGTSPPDAPGGLLDQAVGIVDDSAVLAALAETFGERPDWVRRRVAAQVRGEMYAVDVMAIGTDASATARLAHAAAQAIAREADERSAATYRRQIRDLEAQIDALHPRARADTDVRRLAELQEQLSLLNAQLAALDAAPETFGFTVVNRAQAIEIDEAGFVARWQANSARTAD